EHTDIGAFPMAAHAGGIHRQRGAGVQFPRRRIARRHRPVLDRLTVLEINDLRTHFFTHDGVVRAVDGVTLSIQPGETLGLVGESGCGKSVTAHSLLQLLPPTTSRIVSGSMHFTRRNGEVVDLAALDPRGARIRSIRGNEIAMIFQEPMTSLSPV